MSSIARSVSQPVARSVQNWSSANVSKLIKSLFADGTQGIYLNAQDAVSVSDLSSIKDLSGNNNHALQTDSMKRASLITDPSGYKSLKFDGIDDGYATQSINFRNTDKVTVIAAVRKLSDTTAGMIVGLSSDRSALNNSWDVRAPDSGADLTFLSHGSFAAIGSQVVSYTGVDFKANNNLVAVFTGDIGGSRNTGRINGGNSVIATGAQGTGNYGNYPLYIGRRGGTSLPFNGQIYAILVIGKLLDDATIQRIEKEFAKYMGITL